jgi:hypothetical protein
VPRSNAHVNQVVPAILGLLLVIGAVLVAWRLAAEVFPQPRSFEDDHGVGTDAPWWLQCVAESVERHPWPFTTGDFRLTETSFTGTRELLIEGTFRSTKVQVVEGNITYWWWRGRQYLGMDCPHLGPRNS